jgi:hypothetical protein
MSPYLQLLVSIGAWAQAHHELVLAVFGTIVLVLGMARFTWCSSVHNRRPWQ